MAAYVQVQRTDNVTGFVRLTEIKEWQAMPKILSARHEIICVNGEGEELAPVKIWYIDKNDEIGEFNVSSDSQTGLFALLLELE